MPPGIRPEWYFLAMFQVLKLLPAHIMGLEGEMLGVLGFRSRRHGAAVPAVPRSRGRGGPVEPPGTVGGVIALAYMLVFTIYGYLAA